MNYIVTKVWFLALLVSLSALTPQSNAAQGCLERIMGHGKIEGESGSLGNFSVRVVYDLDTETAAGNFTYVNRDEGIAVRSDLVFDYGLVDIGTRIISFMLEGYGEYDEARVVLTDAGKSGEGDTLEVQLLLSGNIVYHTPAELARGKITLREQSCL